MSTTLNNSQQQGLLPIEGYPAIEALLEDYKRRATIRVRRIHLWGFAGSAVAWLVWRWMDGSDWTMRGLVIVCALQVWVAIAANLAWAKKIAGSVLSDWSEFEKVLRSQFQEDQENAMLKDLDGELASGYAHINGTYLTKSWLVRLDFDIGDSKNPREPIIIIKLSGIDRAELRSFNTERLGPAAGSGPKNVTLKFKGAKYRSYRFCFLKRESRKEFLDALIERIPDIQIVDV